MSNISIEFENISKQYRLGTIGTGTLTHDLNRWWHLVRGKEDPYLKVGEVNDRSIKATSDYVWALKDISFNVEQGEVLGIIGKNGAGKSTLLKILSRVTSPTTGSIKAKGRIASLLEVGTGFHGELTGRENIYMNGAILGMTRREIVSKFDEIVDFSGIEKYIDTPVKRYSSGMTVRLGFAVAAHLEPEILVVDEVLAVGDAEFQKKAIGKMKDVSQGGGRTVLFVSHNMTAVKSLCTKGLLLENGISTYSGSIDSTINRYIAGTRESLRITNNVNQHIKTSEDNLILEEIYISTNNEHGVLYIDEAFECCFKIDFKERIDNFNLSLSFCDEVGATVFVTTTALVSCERGEKLFKCNIPANLLNTNLYSLILLLVKNSSQVLTRIDNALFFEMHEKGREGTYFEKYGGGIRPLLKWEII